MTAPSYDIRQPCHRSSEQDPLSSADFISRLRLVTPEMQEQLVLESQRFVEVCEELGFEGVVVDGDNLTISGGLRRTAGFLDVMSALHDLNTSCAAARRQLWSLLSGDESIAVSTKPTTTLDQEISVNEVLQFLLVRRASRQPQLPFRSSEHPDHRKTSTELPADTLGLLAKDIFERALRGDITTLLPQAPVWQRHLSRHSRYHTAREL